MPNSPIMDQMGPVEVEAVEYTEPQAWCSLSYYELNTRVK